MSKTSSAELRKHREKEAVQHFIDVRSQENQKLEDWERQPGLLTHEQLAELEAAYHIFCNKKTKKINSTSLQNLLRSLGIQIRLQKCEELISEWSDNGEIGKAEFLSVYCLAYKKMTVQQEFFAIFELLDEDHDGLVAIAKLRTVFAALEPKLSSKQINSLIFDAFPEHQNNFRAFFQDGKINFDQFVHMMLT